MRNKTADDAVKLFVQRSIITINQIDQSYSNINLATRQGHGQPKPKPTYKVVCRKALHSRRVIGRERTAFLSSVAILTTGSRIRVLVDCLQLILTQVYCCTGSIKSEVIEVNRLQAIDLSVDFRNRNRGCGWQLRAARSFWRSIRLLDSFWM